MDTLYPFTPQGTFDTDLNCDYYQQVAQFLTIIFVWHFICCVYNNRGKKFLTRALLCIIINIVNGNSYFESRFHKMNGKLNSDAAIIYDRGIYRHAQLQW